MSEILEEADKLEHLRRTNKSSVDIQRHRVYDT
jgi:hypothetical protein